MNFKKIIIAICLTVLPTQMMQAGIFSTITASAAAGLTFTKLPMPNKAIYNFLLERNANNFMNRTGSREIGGRNEATILNMIYLMGGGAHTDAGWSLFCINLLVRGAAAYGAYRLTKYLLSDSKGSSTTNTGKPSESAAHPAFNPEVVKPAQPTLYNAGNHNDHR